MNVDADRLRWTPSFGPEHPAGHGPMEWDFVLSGTQIAAASPVIYPMHRGAEKLFESRDYRQALMLANRHDWHSASGSELGLALTIESMLGIVVPQRATWIRTLLSELSRAIHHVRWLGETARELGEESLAESAKTIRERLIDTQEEFAGGRMHTMIVQPGGLREDCPPDWTTTVRTVAKAAAQIAPQLSEWVRHDERLAGVATLSEQDAIAYGASGPVARASGLSLDLRFDSAYCAYPELIEAKILRRIVRTAGDTQARLVVISDEFAVALDCIVECANRLDALTDGPVSVRLPRSLRLPEGAGYGWTENPTGINGWYVVSRGAIEPYRLKIRSASFGNAQAASAAVIGESYERFPIALMSFLVVAGDLAK